MRQYRQRIYADPMMIGDCLTAAVASLCDAEYDEVPHFARWRGWWDALRMWARARGMDVGCLQPEQVQAAVDRDPDWSGLMIGSGPSARTGLQHAVIVDRRLELVWDPHPSDAGLAHVDELLIFVDSPYLPGPYLPALTAVPSSS